MPEAQMRETRRAERARASQSPMGSRPAADVFVRLRMGNPRYLPAPSGARQAGGRPPVCAAVVPDARREACAATLGGLVRVRGE